MLNTLKAYAPVIGAGIWLASIAGAFWLGQDWKAEKLENQKLREESLFNLGVKAAQKATAEEIGKIEVRNVTIRQETEREIVEKPVYRDCQHTDEFMSVINEAVTGERRPFNPAELPETATPER